MRPIASTEATVALRKESVDRNKENLSMDDFVTVALRKESVDRNMDGYGGTKGL